MRTVRLAAGAAVLVALAILAWRPTSEIAAPGRDGPGTACLAGAELAALREGTVQPVLVLTAFDPGESGSGEVALTWEGGEAQVIGLFPVAAFSTEAGDPARRIFLDPPPALPETGPLCAEIAPAPGARVDAALEAVPGG